MYYACNYRCTNGHCRGMSNQQLGKTHQQCQLGGVKLNTILQCGGEPSGGSQAVKWVGLVPSSI